MNSTTIKKNGKTIVKKGNPKVFDIIIRGKRIKYWFWKIEPTNDFEETWTAADREITHDSVEYRHLATLLNKRIWGDDLTVWDGEEYEGRISTYWYNTGQKGDESIDLKKLTDLYNGEWYVVDENGIPFIEKQREEAREQHEENMRKMSNRGQKHLHETNYTPPNSPNISVTRPQTEQREGRRIQINRPQDNSSLNRGRQIQVNIPQQTNNNQGQTTRPSINVIKRNF